MNVNASTRTHFLSRTLVLGLLAGLSLGAQAGEARHAGSANRAVVVSYADLDLTSTAGASTLYARLESAASKACGHEPTASLWELNRMAAYEACYEHALAKAVNQVDNDTLHALHAERRTRSSMG